MNIVSKIHKRFSESLNNPRVLENPEEFLGPNFEAVLNFWLILDELSEEQIKVVKERYEAFLIKNPSECSEAIALAYDASEGVVGDDYAYYAGFAACYDTNSWASHRATSELIGMYKILENHQKPLTFFEMILDVLCQ
jgi:hypothetical protein